MIHLFVRCAFDAIELFLYWSVIDINVNRQENWYHAAQSVSSATVRGKKACRC